MVQVLYNEGGRKFWVHNTGPLGCLPQKLTLVENKVLDGHGCISNYNEAAKIFNAGLLHLCGEMRSELKDATIVYVDIYSIKQDLIVNSIKYGFASPLMACCGNGGPPYNYNKGMTCGNPGSKACEIGSKFISWDGIHYTEAANSIVTHKVLSTAYSTPPTPFHFFCRPWVYGASYGFLVFFFCLLLLTPNTIVFYFIKMHNNSIIRRHYRNFFKFGQV